ncbi:MAG: SH2 domain-containing protein [Rhabdochlamydiaceae bacterium]
MSTFRAEKSYPDFVQNKIDEITSHVAWYDDITGTEAELLLRNKADLTYLLRPGEKEGHYYLTYVKGAAYFTHIPLRVDNSLKEWFYMNAVNRMAPTLREFIPSVMHAEEAEVTALVPLTRM